MLEIVVNIVNAGTGDFAVYLAGLQSARRSFRALGMRQCPQRLSRDTADLLKGMSTTKVLVKRPYSPKTLAPHPDVLHEHGEVPCRAVDATPNRTRPTFSKFRSSDEDERDLMPDSTSALQSFKVQSPTKSEDCIGTAPGPRPGVLTRPTISLSTPGADAASPATSRASPTLQNDTSSSSHLVTRSLFQLLVGSRESFRPAQPKSGPPVVERPFTTTDTLRIKKNEYDAYKETLEPSLSANWHNDIHRRLQKDVEAVIHGTSLNQNEMTVSVGLSMVGPKVGDMLHLRPTIVISCAHKLVKTRIEQLVGSDQLDYLRDFACRCVVRVRGREPSRRDRFFANRDSAEAMGSTEAMDPYNMTLQEQKSLWYAVEPLTALRSACGLNIEFAYSPHGLLDSNEDRQVKSGYEHRMTARARIGGVVYIGTKAFAFTTAHTFLLHTLDQQNDAESDCSSTSDADSEADFDRAYSHEFNENQAKTTTSFVTPPRAGLHGIDGSYAFCDHGRSFGHADSVPLRSANSDWCILATDLINSVTNCYRAENERGEVEEVTIDKVASEEMVEPGSVYIVERPEKPVLAYLTQTTTSIHFGETSLKVRRLISEHPLSAGISGCWVVRGRELLGHIVGGNSFEQTVYMVCVQDTRRAIEELTGDHLSLEPPNREVLPKSQFKGSNPLSEISFASTGDRKSSSMALFPRTTPTNRLSSVLSDSPAGITFRRSDLFANPEVQSFLAWTAENSCQSIKFDGEFCYTRCQFVPDRAITEYFDCRQDRNYSKVKKLVAVATNYSFGPLDVRDLAKYYPKVFTILVVIGQSQYINFFVRQVALRDSKLPFSLDKRDLFPKLGGDTTFFDDFYKVQWQFCVEPLSYRLGHVMFENDRVLPIISMERIDKSQGLSASVHKITVHEEYDKLCQSLDFKKNSHEYVVKSYHDPRADDYYSAEVEAFQKLHRLSAPVPNLISFYGAFTQDRSHHTILEYANIGTLEDYWAKVQPPRLGEGIVTLWDNLFKLAGALVNIHDNVDTNPTGRPQTFQGCHADIKPSNILVTGDIDSKPYEVQFMLADLGLSHFSTVIKGGQSITKMSTGSSQAYGAPELNTARGTIHRHTPEFRPNIDIWSLACVYSEFNAWIVGGMDGKYGVRRYRQERMSDEDVDETMGACFYNKTGGLQREVKSWHADFQRICRMEDSITPILWEKLLKYMFELSPSSRPGARQVLRYSEAVIIEARNKLPSSSAYKELEAGSYHRDGPRTTTPPQLSPGLSFQQPHGVGCAGYSWMRLHDWPETESSTLRSTEVSHISSDFHSTPIGTAGTPLSSFNSRGQPSFPGVEHISEIAELFDQTKIKSKEKSVDTQSRSMHNRGPSVNLTVMELNHWAQQTQERSRKSFLRRHENLPLPHEDELIGELSRRDHIFILDDSRSMAPCWRDVTQLFNDLIYMIKKKGLDPDGSELRFMTSDERKVEWHTTKLKNMARDRGKRLFGESDFANRLEEIFGEYQKMLAAKSETRPMSLYVFTDGKWRPGDRQLDAVARSIKRLVDFLESRGEKENMVGIQFIRFGNDEVGSERLRWLDEDLKEARGLARDICDTTSADGNVWKMLLGSINGYWKADSESQG